MTHSINIRLLTW